MAGDELDDGLMYEMDSEVDEGVLLDTEDAPTSKRSAESDEETTGSKRQKKRKNDKLLQKRKEKMEYEKQQRRELPTKSAQEISDFFTTMIREKNPDLSPLELDDLYLKKQHFLSTMSYEKERSLENFQDFMSQFSKSPKAIVISGTNMRVADVFRGLGSAKKCLKMFSKTKLKDDVEKINNLKENVKYLLCTPTRLQKIIESTDALFQGKDKLDIFLDASFLDTKTNSVITGDDSQVLISVLREFLNKKSSVKILLY